MMASVSDDLVPKLNEHFFLLSSEIFIFSMGSSAALAFSYLLNQVQYYEEFFWARIFMVVTPIIFSIGLIILYLYLNEAIEFIYVFFYFFIFIIFEWELRSEVLNEIIAKDGIEFFFYNYFLYLLGLAVIWVAVFAVMRRLDLAVKRRIQKTQQAELK